MNEILDKCEEGEDLGPIPQRRVVETHPVIDGTVRLFLGGDTQGKPFGATLLGGVENLLRRGCRNLEHARSSSTQGLLVNASTHG